MSSHSRKDAIREYRQRPRKRGVFAIRCQPTGRVWVGSSHNLDSARDREFVMLSQGANNNVTLRADWTVHGDASFTFEAVEALPADTPDFSINDLLKSAVRSWAATLGATTLLP